jgi:hypothetical protein
MVIRNGISNVPRVKMAACLHRFETERELVILEVRRSGLRILFAVIR